MTERITRTLTMERGNGEVVVKSVVSITPAELEAIERVGVAAFSSFFRTRLLEAMAADREHLALKGSS